MNHTTGKRGDRWRVLGRVLLFVCSCAVVLAATAPVASKLRGGWREVVIGTVASMGAFALTALFVRWESLRLEEVGARLGRGSLARLAFGFLLGLLLVAVWALMLVPAAHLRWIRASGVGLHATTIALAGYLALSCREELAFHGYPLRRLERNFGLWPAQILIALLFAAEHRLGGSPWVDALVGPGVGSLLFGMAAIATRGLAVPIGLHAAWNFGQWALGLKSEPGLWRSVSEGGGEQRAHLIAMIAYVAVVFLATLTFWLWHRRRESLEVSRSRV
jgi:membrane protease YdiL (CAAX protease family)